MKEIRFGPAGTGEKMKEIGIKKSSDIPAILKNMGLNAFEYQCGHGVTISEDSAKKFGAECLNNGIVPSLHTPYFISLSSVNEETRLKSIDYILQSAVAAKAMGAQRMVVHSGSCSKISRQEALDLAKSTLKMAREKLDENGFEEMILCPETMGKINQLGTLEEVLELCSLSERFIPCIDFGHLNARTHGQVNSSEAFSHILDSIANKLGTEVMKIIHCHFSKIEYGDGGEKKHLTFEDEIYGPEFLPLADELLKRDSRPTIICESAGTQEIDAKIMFDIYSERKKLL